MGPASARPAASSFSGFTPPGSVCAPGVAIVSTVPGGGFAARDGTAAAAAHIVGFAALLLAHYPLFRTVYATRGEPRVAALFETIRASCDPSHLRAGLADLRYLPERAFLAWQPDRGDAAPQAPSATASSIAAGGGGFAGMPPAPLLQQLRAMDLIA